MAFDIVGRNAIIRDPGYHNGQYYDQGHGPVVGLAIARMLGHITYLSLEAMTQKFDALGLHPRDVQTQFETKFSVGSYLAYQGDRFGERFDANSYITLTTAIDLFDLGDTRAATDQSLRPGQVPLADDEFYQRLAVSALSTQQMVDALIADDKPVSYCNVRTDCGHDAFLLPDDLKTYGELMAAFLADLGPPDEENGDMILPAVEGDPRAHGPRSIFHHHRLDYNTILDLIPPGSSVLDLGCGTGGLLARLRERGRAA